MFIATARRAVSRIGRNRSFPRRLPKQYGAAQFYASTEGGLKYLRRQAHHIDPELLAMAKRFVPPRGTIWDIGANLGLFAFAAAGLAGPQGTVVAVEPDTWLVGLLRRSAAANPGLAPVHIVPAAVAEAPGVSSFHVANRSRATNYLDGAGSTQTDGSRETQHVPTVTLDILLDQFGPPQVIKVDVERAEVLVLRGGPRTLAHHPALIMEVGSDQAVAVTGILREAGYDLFSSDSQGSLSPVEEATYSTVALHRGGR